MDVPASKLLSGCGRGIHLSRMIARCTGSEVRGQIGVIKAAVVVDEVNSVTDCVLPASIYDAADESSTFLRQNSIDTAADAVDGGNIESDEHDETGCFTRHGCCHDSRLVVFLLRPGWYVGFFVSTWRPDFSLQDLLEHVKHFKEYIFYPIIVLVCFVFNLKLRCRIVRDFLVLRAQKSTKFWS